jgi:enoyl-CoA hydratase/carnithine racemase
MSDASVLIVEDRDAVRNLRLNRPHKLNALDTALMRALRDELRRAADTASVHAILLSAEGRAFCAGVDLGEFKNATGDTRALSNERSEISLEMFTLICRHPKPVVSAVRGAAIGAGAALAIGCDMMVIAADTKLSFPEIKHAMLPGIVMPILQRQFGHKLGFELITTARQLLGEELLALGVANRVVPSEKIEAEAMALADTCAAADPAVMMASKKLFHEVAELPFEAALAHSRTANARLRASQGKS